jgi:Flp pilus assembly protein TadD
MRRALAFLAPIFLLALGAPAQEPPQAPQGPAPGQEEGSDLVLIKRSLEFLAGGDAAGAVALLEPVRQRTSPPPQLLALLGAAYLEAGRAGDALEVLTPLADDEAADPAVLYNAGRAALATGDVERGGRYLERSVELEPGTPAARELGLLRGIQDRMRQSYLLLRPWARANPDDQEARLAAALAAIRLNRVPEAEELLEGLPMESDQVRLLWGQIRLLRDDPQGAIATLAPILAGEAGEVDLAARRTTAEARLALDQPEEAVRLLEGRAAGDPTVSLVLGQAQYRTGEVDAAIATLQPFAERLLAVAQAADGPIASQDLAARYALAYGRFLAAAGRHQEALPHLELVTRLQPNNRHAWQLLGETLTAVGRGEEAAAALARFESLGGEEGLGPAGDAPGEIEDPTERATLRARRLLEDGRHDDALAELRAEIELAPEDVRPRLLESRALLLAGRPAEALQQAEALVAGFPEHPDAYYQRGTAHLAMDHRAPAEADFRQALVLAPDHVAAMSDLAVLLIAKGERAEAERLLERVLELRPDDPGAKASLDRLRKAQGG